MEFHEVASIFPILQGDEYRALRDDIAANGLLEAIWTYQGKIIDGRNRYIACMDLEIEPRYQEWNGNGSLVTFIISSVSQYRNYGRYSKQRPQGFSNL